MKQWEVMLADLNGERARTQADYQAKNASITTLGDQLDRVFNAQAAHYVLPPFTPWGRRRLNESRQDATALTDSLTAQVQQQEFNHDQLGALLNELNLTLGSPISPGIRETLDDSMKLQGALLRSVVSAAFEGGSEAHSMESTARKLRLRDREKTVFHQFLREEPKAATIIRNMIAQPSGAYRIASDFGDTQNVVTDDDIVILSRQLRLMLRESALPGELSILKEYTGQKDSMDGIPEFVQQHNLAMAVEIMKQEPERPARLLYSLNGYYCRQLALQYFGADKRAADLETPKP